MPWIHIEKCGRLRLKTALFCTTGHSLSGVRGVNPGKPGNQVTLPFVWAFDQSMLSTDTPKACEITRAVSTLATFSRAHKRQMVLGSSPVISAKSFWVTSGSVRRSTCASVGLLTTIASIHQDCWRASNFLYFSQEFSESIFGLSILSFLCGARRPGKDRPWPTNQFPTVRLFAAPSVPLSYHSRPWPSCWNAPLA